MTKERWHQARFLAKLGGHHSLGLDSLTFRRFRPKSLDTQCEAWYTPVGTLDLEFLPDRRFYQPYQQTSHTLV